MSCLDLLDDEVADTVRQVLGRRAPDLLRALEDTQDPTMVVRQQVNDVLGDEAIRELVGPDWEPTAHCLRVEKALDHFFATCGLTEPVRGTDQWPPDPDLRGDRAGRP